jgi:predicted P-loop ATPase/GTPase
MAYDVTQLSHHRHTIVTILDNDCTMPKGIVRGKRLESRKPVNGHQRSWAASKRRHNESNRSLQLVILVTIAALPLAVLGVGFAMSRLDPAHANEVWSTTERIITIAITGLFTAIGTGFFRH